jgi:hypothetical protein
MWYMGALLFLVWFWFIKAYDKITTFLINTNDLKLDKITLSIHRILVNDLGLLSYIVVISLFVFYGFLLLSCRFTLRRLVKFSSFEQYERNIQHQVEDLRNFIRENQQ